MLWELLLQQMVTKDQHWYIAEIKWACLVEASDMMANEICICDDAKRLEKDMATHSSFPAWRIP